MRRLLTALVLWPALSLADDTPTKFKVQVGHSKPLSLGGPVSVGICDDKSIVSVGDGTDALKLTGLKVGKTKCGFWKPAETTGTHTVIEVIVSADDPDAAPAK